MLKAFNKMSMLSAAALLDELMGVDRNRAPDEKKTALHWSDPQVIEIRRTCFFSYFFYGRQFGNEGRTAIIIHCNR